MSEKIRSPPGDLCPVKVCLGACGFAGSGRQRSRSKTRAGPGWLISCPVRCRGAWHVSACSAEGGGGQIACGMALLGGAATPFLEGEYVPRGEAWRKQLLLVSPVAHAVYRGHG